MSRLQQIQPVPLGLAQRLLMAEDHLLAVIVYLADGDKAAPLLDHFRSGHLEALRVGKDRRRLLLRQHSLLLPGVQIARRAGVDALSALGVKKLRQTQNNADKIVWAALVVGLLHRRRDLVVGLRDHVLQADGRGVVTPGAKGVNVSHEEGLSPADAVEFAL